MSKITLIAASLAITSAVLTACVPTTQSGNGDNIVTKPTADLVRVEGQVAYRERMAIPADAVIIIRIDNIARADQRRKTHCRQWSASAHRVFDIRSPQPPAGTGKQ